MLFFPSKTIRELEIKNDDFYQKIQKEGNPKSSQPSVGDFYEVMKEIVSKGYQIVGVFISSKMSGTINSFLAARKEILKEYPDARIEIVDSESNSMQLGLATIEGAKAAKEGRPIEEVVKAIEETKKRTRYLFVPDSLEYLIKGGRIGGAKALIASLLHIIPILTVEKGEVQVFAKLRSKKKALKRMLQKLCEDNEKYRVKEVIVHHINVLDEAKKLAGEVIERIGIKPSIVDIGPVVGLNV